MNLPGVPGMAVSAAAHVINNRQEQTSEIPPEQIAYQASQASEWQQVPNVPSAMNPNADMTAVLAKAMAANSRNKMIGRIVSGVTVLGVTGAVLYACEGGDSSQSFGHHSEAQVDTNHTRVANFVLKSNLDTADMDAANDSSLVGLSYTCLLPWGGGCVVPDSIHTVAIHNTGTYSLFLLKGAHVTGELDANGKPSVKIDMDNSLLQSRVYNTHHEPNDGNHNIGWDAVFGSSETQPDLQSATEDEGSDSLQAVITKSLDSQPRVVDAAIAQALQSQLGLGGDVLQSLDANGSAILKQISKPGTTFVFDHHGKLVDIQPDHKRMYQPEKKVKIAGVSVKFGKDSTATFDTATATRLGDLAHDTSVVIKNEPGVPDTSDSGPN